MLPLKSGLLWLRLLICQLTRHCQYIGDFKRTEALPCPLTLPLMVNVKRICLTSTSLFVVHPSWSGEPLWHTRNREVQPHRASTANAEATTTHGIAQRTHPPCHTCFPPSLELCPNFICWIWVYPSPRGGVELGLGLYIQEDYKNVVPKHSSLAYTWLYISCHLSLLIGEFN